MGGGDPEENIAEIAGLKGEMSTGGLGEGSLQAGDVKVRDRVRRARMPIWTLNCVTGTCNTEGAWRPAYDFIC